MANSRRKTHTHQLDDYFNRMGDDPIETPTAIPDFSIILAKKVSSIRRAQELERIEQEQEDAAKIFHGDPSTKENDREHFKQEYMMKGATSDSYLEKAVQDIPMREIRDVVSSCYFDENNKFCAVLSKVKDLELKGKLGASRKIKCNYLFEVWSQGQLLYQRALKKKIQVWNPSRQNNSIIYLLHPYEEEGQDGSKSFIHILSLKNVDNMSENILDGENMKEQKVVQTKLRDWTGMTGREIYLGNYNKMQFALDRNNILYFASQKEMYATTLNDLRHNDDAVSLSVQDSAGKDSSSDLKLFGPKTKTAYLDFGDNLKMHILYDTEESFKSMNSVCGIWERSTQLDFIQICASDDKTDPSKLLLELVQTQEFKPAKELRNDKITDIHHVCLKDNDSATVVVTKQGQVDLYWNKKLVTSSEDYIENKSYEDCYIYSNVSINFDSVIMEREKKGAVKVKLHPVMLSLKQQQRTKLTNLVVLPKLSPDDLQFFRNQKYRDLLKPFQEILYYQDFLIVAHGNFLSYYDTLKQKWIGHYKFEDDQQDPNDSLQSNYSDIRKNKVISVFRDEARKSGTFSIGVLFQDGTIKTFSIKQDNGRDTMYLLPKTFKISGKIKCTTKDLEHGRILYVISEIEQRGSDTSVKKAVKLWVFAQGELYDLTSSFQGVLKADTKVIPYYSPAENTQVIIMSPDENFFRIYENQVITDDVGLTAISLVRKKKIYLNNLHDKIDTNSIHHALSTKDQEFFILIDKKHMYVLDTRQIKLNQDTGGYNIPEENFFVHKDRFIQGLKLIENRYLYVLHNKLSKPAYIMNLKTGTPQQRARAALLSSGNGAAMLDLSTLFTDPSKRCPMIPICSAVVGCNDQITFSETNQKLVILMGFQRLRILPMLHQNLMHFQQQKKRENYLFASQTKDRFQALSKQGKISEWCMMTGQLIEEALIKDNKFTKKYDSYDFNISQKIGLDQIVENSEFEVFRSLDETKKQKDNIPLYSKNLFPHTLLVMKEEDKEMNDRQFYGRRIMKYASDPKELNLKLNCLATVKKYHTFVVIGLSQDDKIEVKANFVFPKALETNQNIFISDDCKNLMEFCDNDARVYAIEKVTNDENCIECRITFDYIVKNLPLGIFDNDPYQLYCLFSPSFYQHLDIDQLDGTIVVRNSLTGDEQFKIPDTFLSLNRRSRDKIMMQTRFMAWQSQKQLAIIDINAEPPIEVIIEIPTDEMEEEKQSFEAVTSATVPFLDMAQYKETYLRNLDDRPHGVSNYFKANLNYDKNDQISRLKRKHRIYKHIWYNQNYENNIEAQIKKATKYHQTPPSATSATPDCPEEEDLRQLNVFKELFSVDFVNDHQYYMIEKPFVFINWRQIELLQEIIQDTSRDASKYIAKEIPISQEQAQQLCLNILPQCSTILHLTTQSFEFCQQLCSIASQKDENGVSQFHIPFNADIDGKSPLHFSLSEGQTENTRTAEFFLKDLLQKMPLDHHGRAIVDLLPECIKKEIKYTGEYMDSRFITTKQLQKVSRAKLSKIKENSDSIKEGYYITHAQIWPEKNLLQQRIFQQSSHGADIEVTCLDLPRLHSHYKPEKNEFITALSRLTKSDIMKHDSIKAIIQFEWQSCYRYIMYSRLIPFCFYLYFYFIYSVYMMDLDYKFYEEEKSGGDEYPLWFHLFIKFWALILLPVFSVYFLAYELIQLSEQGYKLYFTDPWSYLDVVPPLIIMFDAVLTGFQSATTRNSSLTQLHYSCQAIASFGMWLKIFYFLRVFRRTGFFVNMLFKVVQACITFFTLYVLILIAFASSFAIMTPGGEDGFRQQFNYAFMVGLGEFGNMEWTEGGSDEKFTPAMMQIFFILSTVIVLIVMLNILIALVSDAYADVIATQQQVNDFERAILIAELYPFYSNKTAKENDYLIKAQIAGFKKESNSKDDDK